MNHRAVCCHRGARSYHKGLKFEEHGHALPTFCFRLCYVAEGNAAEGKRAFEDSLDALDAEARQNQIGLRPMVGRTVSKVCLDAQARPTPVGAVEFVSPVFFNMRTGVGLHTEDTAWDVMFLVSTMVACLAIGMLLTGASTANTSALMT